MDYRKLGNSDIAVSVICLGTMTYGEQNNQEQAFAQMDYAHSQGVNFFDTAELYAIPPKPETYGQTEIIIGKWLKARQHRHKIVLASKIAGPGEEWIPHIRGGQTRFNQKYITEALDASLKRLQTDYIDLYQLHWPERKTNYFGQLGYTPETETSLTPLIETLQVLNEKVKAGKIRYIGLSNETPWGIMRFLQLAEQFDLPGIVSIQNPYNLLNRSYEVGLAEISCREEIGLLAYSPLGFGTLSGKYLNGQQPDQARLTLFPHYTRYSNAMAITAIEKYVALAQKNDLDPAQMALAYVNSRAFLTSTIIGATNLTQLKHNIESIDITLPEDVLEGIEHIHQEYPNPSP
ncbi:MAG: NADP(H)-dependent aldo-keto reductase [Nitrosomonas sp.]|nr:NADP(H)-dependent aldo-keto reductase [Nitrosomonas sp.]